MKYVIILPDGAADDPLPQLAGRTPLAVARLPHMDWIAANGRLGRFVTIPPGFTPGTDVGTLSVFGYDPHVYFTGRAPLEAAARGLTVGPDELIFRCNFVTIRDGRMADFTAGHVTQPEADKLIADLNRRVDTGDPALRGCKFHTGVNYRNLMIADGAAGLTPTCQPPHDIPNQPVADHLPRGPGHERVRAIMTAAENLLRDHDVNRRRRAAGLAPVTDIWLWGQGRPTRLVPLADRFGVRGAVITAVDIIRGFALLMGMELIDVPGATGYLDTDYAAKGRYAMAALDAYDVVVVHIESPDEAAHQGSAEEKIAALEQIDAHIVGPLLAVLRSRGDWRMLIAPDHVTSVATRAHGAAPPPFCFAGRGVPAVERRRFCETEAAAGGFLLERGHELMDLFFGA